LAITSFNLPKKRQAPPPRSPAPHKLQFAEQYLYRTSLTSCITYNVTHHFWDNQLGKNSCLKLKQTNMVLPYTYLIPLAWFQMWTLDLRNWTVIFLIVFEQKNQAGESSPIILDQTADSLFMIHCLRLWHVPKTWTPFTLLHSITFQKT
jgi:hypothetical protein